MLGHAARSVVDQSHRETLRLLLQHQRPRHRPERSGWAAGSACRCCRPHRRHCPARTATTCETGITTPAAHHGSGPFAGRRVREGSGRRRSASQVIGLRLVTVRDRRRARGGLPAAAAAAAIGGEAAAAVAAVRRVLIRSVHRHFERHRVRVVVVAVRSCSCSSNLGFRPIRCLLHRALIQRGQRAAACAHQLLLLAAGVAGSRGSQPCVHT